MKKIIKFGIATLTLGTIIAGTVALTNNKVYAAEVAPQKQVLKYDDTKDAL